ncbi:hypothetical protein BJ166DRAFT_593297 [Pestalotiopsis sp. NC0098]|nr:hypothetical protein BJ166DRAFT_593297 [Pestalotiopsis sp. NC0098]
MGRPKRNAHAAAVESMTPPDELTANQSLARVIKAEGNSVYSCSLPDERVVMVELADRFRNTIWVKRGGYVLVDLTPSQEMKGKVEGEIVNVVREEKLWRKQSYWPKEFALVVYSDEEDSDSNVGKMPPSP